MSSWDLQVDLSTTDTVSGFPSCHPFAVSNFLATFVLASFPAEGAQWLIATTLDSSFTP